MPNGAFAPLWAAKRYVIRTSRPGGRAARGLSSARAPYVLMLRAAARHVKGNGPPKRAVSREERCVYVVLL